MPTPRYALAVGVVNGVVYAVGGVNGGELDTVEAYDPATDTWTGKAPMPTARFLLGVGVVNGILYAVGGSGLGSSSTVEAYDPATDTWTTKAPLPEGRVYHAVGVVDDILYVVGGAGGGQPETVYAYDPATDTWTTKAPLPTGRMDFAVGVVNGILYAVGGIATPFEDFGGFRIVEAYDPTTDTWTAKASLLTGRHGLAVGVVNGVLYAVGGDCIECDDFVSTVEAYDPVTDTWSISGSLFPPRVFLGGGVVDDRLFAVGGLGGAGSDVDFGSVVDVYGPLKLIWSSSNPEVAIVGANGQAVGLSPGTTTITARSGSLSGNAVLTVAPTNTTAGTNVTVPLSPGDIIITFDTVSEPGNTTATTSTSVPPPTHGLSLDSPIYDIQTTATFTGPVVICLPYSASTDPAKLSLLRYENDTWTDVTTLRDTTNRLICGQVMSLSPLALGRVAGLANSPWPMFRHDRQHSGRSPYAGPGVPARKWAYVMEQYVNFLPSSPAIGADGTIYAISYNGYSDEPTDPSTRNQLHAVDPDGMLKWKFQLDPNGIIDSSPAVGIDGTIYITSWAPSRLYAVNPDGTLQWTFADDQMTACISSSPAVGPDGTIYSGGDGLCAFNPNGTLKWVINIDSVYTSPAVGTDGTIYIVGRTALFAVNPDGTLKWSFEPVEFAIVSPMSLAVGADGTIYVGAQDGNLYAVNSDGTLKWSFPQVPASAHRQPLGQTEPST
jgi:hypothetical protein